MTRRKIDQTKDFLCQYNSYYGEYRVAPRHGTNTEREDRAYYTDDKLDALDTMTNMQERHNQGSHIRVVSV